MKRVLNFYAGPSALPLEALEEAKDEILDFQGTGMSILEISHRAKEYDKLHNETISLMKELFDIPENFEVLMLQGGASLQFAMIPMNLLGDNEKASYIVTGRFSNNAFKTAKTLRTIHLASTTEDDGKYFRIPEDEEIRVDPDSIYCHLTSNNTIFGTQWKRSPITGSIPIVADMSSDIMSRKIDFGPVGLIYAGAQKNLGPAGITVIIIRKDLVDRSRNDLPDILSYKVHVSKNSLYNTPSCFAVYMMNKVLHWVKNKGGLEFVEKQNEEKAKLVYEVIDKNPSFFINRVEKKSRSSMNVVFNLQTKDMESKFLEEAKNNGMIGLKGHRSVGGVRISMYNAHGIEDIKVLVDFMEDFVKKNG